MRAKKQRRNVRISFLLRFLFLLLFFFCLLFFFRPDFVFVHFQICLVQQVGDGGFGVVAGEGEAASVVDLEFAADAVGFLFRNFLF